MPAGRSLPSSERTIPWRQRSKEKRPHKSGVETLEARIAPAYGAFLASAPGLAATYDDVDGGHATVKATARFINNQAPPGAGLGIEAGPLGNGSGYLGFLDLTTPNFNGTNLTFTVVKVPGSTATFGFAAEQMVSFKHSGGATAALSAGASTDKFAGLGLAGTARPVGPCLSTTVNDRFAMHALEV